jgi:glutamate-1-semialdehyde 2,1-aminomutase
VGNIYQAGTLSGNPLAVASGLAMLRHLKAHPEVYTRIGEASARICAAFPAGMTVNRVGSMFTAFFTDMPVTDFETAKAADTTKFRAFFHHMLERGVYLPPSQFEAAFVSAAHDDGAVEQTVTAIREFFA